MNFFSAAALFCFLPWLAACAAPQPGPFYQQAANKAAPPGTLIAVEPFTPNVAGAAAYRVLYNSEDIDGHIIPVSGVVYIPAAAPPAGGRNVVAWAHPTTGVAAGCAPSLNGEVPGAIGMADTIPGLASFIAAGDIVTATDYQGLGAPGVHPYLVGNAEGQNIIDSVRAVRRLPGAEITGAYAVWGHSQGAQAALFTGQIAKTYAPELRLVGVAAAAPPTDLNGEFAEPFDGPTGRDLGAYVYSTWAQTYHVPVTTIVDPRAVAAMNVAAAQCITSLGEGLNAVRAGMALAPVFLAHQPANTPPWPALFAENSPGLAPPGTPLLIVQGSKDTTVEPHWTRGFVAKLCARHDTLDYVEFKGVTHLLIGYKSAELVANWIAGRFAGTKPPDTCRS
jgi:alpha-beta hydrolase superfamily lysophospholipase